MKSPLKFLPKARKQGVALILVLAFVVLLTGLILAYFSRSMTDRQLSNSSFNQTKVDAFAKSAVDIVVGDMKQEIVNGSSATTINNVTTYRPSSPANMLPTRSGNPPLASGVDPIPNLVRTSNHNDTGISPLVSSKASNVIATGVSANGRSISLARWNSHYLIPRLNTGVAIDSTPVAAFTAPDWVFVGPSGPAVITNPTSTVTGRYAYAIYDEGGLLDVNVAGYPGTDSGPPSSTGLTATQIGQKGTIALADLTKVSLPQDQTNQIVGWRNYATSQPSSGSFNPSSSSSRFAFNTASATQWLTNFVKSNNSGFLKTSLSTWNGRTDQMFLSRQQLLSFRSATGFSQNVLQYLGTFSRELNAPSWKPSTPVGSTIDYAAQADNVASINRNVLNVRAGVAGTITSYHNDGSSYTYNIKAGEPLLQRRFPLGRLNWIGPSGPQNGGTAANIQACFGLLWDAARGIWKYVGASGSTEQTDIKTLGAIAAEAAVREPNFFELLQAGMLSGSLALESHLSVPGTRGNTHNYYTFQEARIPLHVFRIGASILSQYEASNNPIVVEYNDTYKYSSTSSPVETYQATTPWQACGIENLPYLNMFTALGGRDTADITASSLWCYLLFGVWNPHQGNMAAPMPKVRLHVKGTLTMGNYYGDYAAPVYAYGIAYPGYVATIDDTLELSSSVLNGTSAADPHAMYPTDITSTLGLGDANGMAWTQLPATINGLMYVGYRLPNFRIDMTRTPTTPTTATNNLTWQYVWMWLNTDLLHPFNFWLEYQNPSGAWVPYNYHAGINDPATWITKSPGFSPEYISNQTAGGPMIPPSPLQPLDPPATGISIFYYLKQHWETVDPSALRFHFSQLQSTPSSPAWSAFLRGSIWSEKTDMSDPVTPTYGYKGSQNIQAYFGGAQWRPAPLSRNNTVPAGSATTPAAYVDPDGVQRVADSGLFTASPASNGWQGDPYALSTTRSKDRPIILNRPFTSVAELGYVARDYAWRTLDFFSANSGDAGLLDLFTMNDSDSSMVAGRVNLNTRNSKVIEAILNGTTSDVMDATGNTVVSKASSIATKLVNWTSTTGTNTPLVGREDIVTKFLPSLVAADFTGTDEQNIKARREGVTRGLADAGQTRTWNLLIDVVAQNGRFVPSAKTLNDFTVEGERRYWVHVAIDRFTGEVVDQQLEAVTQ